MEIAKKVAPLQRQVLPRLGQEIQILGATDQLVWLVVRTNREELGREGRKRLSKQKGGKACVAETRAGLARRGVEMDFSAGTNKTVARSSREGLAREWIRRFVGVGAGDAAVCSCSEEVAAGRCVVPAQKVICCLSLGYGKPRL